MLSRWVVLSSLVLSVLPCLAAPPGKPGATPKPAAEQPQAVVRPETHPSPSTEEAIERALDGPATMEFVETPLGDVVTYIGEACRIPVRMDRKALDDVGVKTDSPVTFSADRIKLRSALNLLLRDLDLRWAVSNEVLLITTAKQVDSMLSTRVFDVADLVAVRDEQLRPYNDFDQLIDLVTSTLSPSGWDTVGGPGSIKGFEADGVTALVVRQTKANLAEVEQLLADLRKLKKDGAEPPVRPRTHAAAPEASNCPGQPRAAQPQPE